MSSSSPTTVAADGSPRSQRPAPRPPQDYPDQSSTLAVLLGRAAGRRGPSMLVRETIARELEQRRADWGYSRPVVAPDMVWNAAFVVVSVVMLACIVDERPNTPIRLWAERV